VTPVNDVAVFWVFVWGSFTDWLDGYLARRLDQQTSFGAALDPLADRLYILTAIVVLLARGLVPLMVVCLIVLREVVMGLHLIRAARAGFAPPAVHYVGKAGTLLILYAIPFIFLGASGTAVADPGRWTGLAFLGWGVVTYWVAAVMYLNQYRDVRHVID
jgi:cardiolipin synthase